MYHQFNIQQFNVLPTQYIYVFCVYLKTNSDYFPIQHLLTCFYNRDLTLYSPVVIICTISFTFNISSFCPHTVFMCFVWISEQTTIIALYNFNWLFSKRQSQCVSCTVGTEFPTHAVRHPAVLLVSKTKKIQYRQSQICFSSDTTFIVWTATCFGLFVSHDHTCA